MRADQEALDALVREHVEHVEVIEGRPGGPNNDRLLLHLVSGRTVRIDSYAMTGMTVTVRG